MARALTQMLLGFALALGGMVGVGMVGVELITSVSPWLFYAVFLLGLGIVARQLFR